MGRIFDNARPGFIGFAESHRVGVASASVAAESLVRHFRDMRAAHHYRYANGAHRVCHAIGFGDHPGHGTDADQIDLLLAYVAGDPSFVHGLGVTIDQHYFVSCGGERL